MPDFLPEKALLTCLKKNKKDIAVLVGSPLSMPDNNGSLGVPGVAGILDLIKQKVIEDDLLTDYEEAVSAENDAEKYQQAFAFVKGWLGQDHANDIIQSSVLCAVKKEFKENPSSELNKNSDAWEFPSASEYLGKLVALNKQFKGPILTTNFDPLLSLAVKKSGRECSQTILHSDGDLNQNRSISDACNIVHLHGYWLDSDTMHTTEQLKAKRPKLKASLADLLKNKLLFVIGYGGWDDVFIQALTELMSDSNAQIDIVWAFYEADKDIIQNRYQKLLQSVKPAIDRGRFRIYSGIDCHTFLPKLHSQLENMVTTSSCSSIIEETINPPLNLINGSNDLFSKPVRPHWNYKSDQAHLYIRETEQEQFIALLQKYRYANLVADWGMARLPFLHTLVSKDTSPFYKQPVYLIDCEGVYSRDFIFKVVKDQIGIELQQLIKDIGNEPSVIVFDNVDVYKDGAETIDFLSMISDICNTIVEFSTNIKVIISSRKASFESQMPSLQISELVEYDIKRYVENHSEGGIQYCEKTTLDHLIRLSAGTPMVLDSLLSELKFISISELIESDFRADPISSIINEPIPRVLIKTIDKLSNSEAAVEKHALELLKILSVLSFGDTFKNVRKSVPTKPFHSSHLELLHSLDLLTSLHLNNSKIVGENNNPIDELKLLIVPTLVREYVYSKLSTEDTYYIIKRAADCHFGDKWKVGKPKLCSSSKSLLKDKNKNVGSSEVIITQLLRSAVEQNDTMAIKQVYGLSVFYANILIQNSRHREVVMFATEVKAILNDTTVEIDYIHLDRYMATSLRMSDDNEIAIEFILSVLEKEKEKEISKDIKINLYMTLAHAYNHISNSERAIEFSKKVQSLAGKKKGAYENAKYIITVNTDKDKAKNLFLIERNARKNKYYSIADNAALSIANSETKLSKKLLCYERVINSNGSNYSKYRAVTSKYKALILNGEFGSVSNKDIVLLSSAYYYSYNQKSTKIFNKSHDALWTEAERRGEIISLISLFKSSSLYWRLTGSSDEEQNYAARLASQLVGFVPESEMLSDLSYVKLRVRELV